MFYHAPPDRLDSAPAASNELGRANRPSCRNLGPASSWPLPGWLAMYGPCGKARRKSEHTSRSAGPKSRESFSQNPASSHVKEIQARQTSSFQVDGFDEGPPRRASFAVRVAGDRRDVESSPLQGNADRPRAPTEDQRERPECGCGPQRRFRLRWLGRSLAGVRGIHGGRRRRGHAECVVLGRRGLLSPVAISPTGNLSSPSPRALAARKTFTFSCSPPRELQRHPREGDHDVEPGERHAAKRRHGQRRQLRPRLAHHRLRAEPRHLHAALQFQRRRVDPLPVAVTATTLDQYYPHVAVDRFSGDIAVAYFVGRASGYVSPYTVPFRRFLVHQLAQRRRSWHRPAGLGPRRHLL